MTRTLDLDHLDPDQNAHFNRVAVRIRQEFDTLVAAASRNRVGDVGWILGSIASRNKYVSPLFIRCCRLAFVREWLLREEGQVEIRVADRALASVIRPHVADEGRGSVVCTERMARRVWRILRPPRQLAISVAIFALRWAGRRRPKPMGGQPITLIDTFVLNTVSGDEGSIVGGVYKDRYYPGLLDALTAEEKRSVHFVPTIVGFRNPLVAFRKIRSSSAPLIVLDDYLNSTDYLAAIGSAFHEAGQSIPDVSFEGFSVGPMLREEHRRSCFDFTGMLGVLYYRFARRLAEHGVRVQTLIDWYENQAIDRGLIAGFHRHHPETTVVGYQGYVIAKDVHLYTIPTRTESACGAVPDVIAVTGRGLREDMREFLPDVRVDVGPGFRFQRLWRARKSVPRADTFTVLVGLPIDLGDSAQILELLSRVPTISTDTTLAIRVKPHPTWDPERIRGLVPSGAFPDRWEFVTGDFHDSIETANLLIGNASSVCLEALAKGVPVIVVAPETGIVQNVIPRSVDPTAWALCRDVTEIEDALQRFRGISGDRSLELEKLGNAIREEYFEPVTRGSVLRFLRIDGSNSSQA